MYLAQYSPHLSEKTAILRELVKKDTPWNWCPEHEAAFTEMKNIITQVPGLVLKFYDTGKHATVQLDASQSGLEAVLLQDGKPVPYASKALKLFCIGAQFHRSRPIDGGEISYLRFSACYENRNTTIRFRNKRFN
jgi:hypothetical protein